MSSRRLVFPAILLGAIGMSALLLLPRLRVATAPAQRSPIDPPSLADAGEALDAPEAPAPPQPPAPPAYVHRNPASDTACSPGMVLVDGIYCPFVGHRCTSFLDEEHDVCARYAPEVLCEGALQHRRFCVDVYEYP